MKNKFIKSVLFSLFFIGLFAPRPIFAAEMFFEQEKNARLKDEFKMGIFLGTEELLNAVEGKINFPIDLLELQKVEDGNSIINFWLERPTANKTGEIVFSGIIPGGYKGDKKLIFSMTFLVKKEGAGIFKINDGRILRNDGTGAEAKLQTFDSSFIISKKTPNIQVPASEIKDNDPPESFAPEIAKDKSVFEDRWFLAFATQDKGSGIDHYEVKESGQKIFALFHKWSRVGSPYVLGDQELRSFVFVKAVDKAGNERIVILPPQKSLSLYENYFIPVILIAGSVVAGIILRKFL